MQHNLPFTSTHICRHSGATLFYDKTPNLLALMEMGNWDDEKQAKKYAQKSRQRAKRSVREADAIRNTRGSKRRLRLISND